MNAPATLSTLPAGAAPAADEAAPSLLAHSPAAPPGRWTVLCVDGDADAQLALQRVLRGAGYGVTAAASGEQALQMLQALAQRSMVDVVLAELQLPGAMAGAGEQRRQAPLQAPLAAAAPTAAAAPPAPAHPVPIPSAALEPGMELAGDLISHRGVRMLMAGHRFTPSLIRRVRAFEQRDGAPLLIHIQPSPTTRTPE